MRFNRLDLNLLVALDVLLKECSVSRAAEQMHMSQSAMSNALARLREYFDDELLVSVGRKLELTPRAQALQDDVRDILVRVDLTVSAETRLFDPAQSDRVFKLLVSEFTTDVLMPKALELAWQQSATVRFELLPQTLQPALLLARGEVDLLIIPEGYLAEDHPTEPLFEEDYVCVVWKGNGLIGDTLSFEQYVAASHVTVQIGPEHRPTFEGWFLNKFGVVRKIGVTTPNMTAPVTLVIGTDRIATVHARIARRAAQTLPIRLLPPPIDIPKLKQAMQWHKHRSRDPGLLWLRGLLHQAAVLMDEQ